MLRACLFVWLLGVAGTPTFAQSPFNFRSYATRQAANAAPQMFYPAGTLGYQMTVLGGYPPPGVDPRLHWMPMLMAYRELERLNFTATSEYGMAPLAAWCLVAPRLYARVQVERQAQSLRALHWQRIQSIQQTLQRIP